MVTTSPIFIVGCPRSGTTMVRDLLRSHPNLSIPPESHFIPAFYRAWGDPGSPRDAIVLARRILSLRTIRAWEVQLDPAAFAASRSFAEIVETLFAAYARSESRPRWGDKTPQHVTDLPLLIELFPRARVIHIYRDGRDVALSYRVRGFGPRNVFAAARDWDRLVRAGRRDGRALGPRYAEVRYETLLERPEPTMRSLCEFIEEPYTASVLTPAPLWWRYARHRLARGTFRERSEIERANRGKWRTEMPASDRRLFESVAGELLAELGYELEGGSHRLSPPRRAWLSADSAVRGALLKTRERNFTVPNLLVLAHARLRALLRSTLP